MTTPRNRRLPILLFTAGAAALTVLGLRALADLPAFGRTPHPYGERAVHAALDHDTVNAVASVTLDQRAFDTLGEELVLFAAAVGTILLLRRMRDEDEDAGVRHTYGAEDVFESLRLVGYLFLPLTLLVGWYVVAHGHVSPGGGFQGGVILATALHLAYLAGDYRTLERLRPSRAFDVAEAVGAVGYLAVGFSGLVAGSAYLANWLPHGQGGALASAGTVPLLNVLIGIEVASAFVLLVAKFLEQALLVREPGED